ncbi:MAG: signal peptidase I [Fluviicola sp.]
MDFKLFYLFLLIHPYLAMWWKSFEQAERQRWEALVPGYNYFIAFKLGAQKPWWSLLLIFPGVHIVMWSVVNVSYIRRFGYYSLLDTAQGIFFPYIIMYKIAQSGDKILPETNWANSKEVAEREWGDHLALFLALPVLGHVIALGMAAVTRPKPGKKTKVKEWGDSIWFALVAALIIRTYVFEPFKIPTGSMENTLLVGDFLFVNKVAYGPKVPVTPVSYPLVHNTVPWINVKSYIGLETADYTRIPGYSSVQRNDVVVFNFPAGDTAIYDPTMPTGLMGHNYHERLMLEALYLWELETLGNARSTIIAEIRMRQSSDSTRYYAPVDLQNEIEDTLYARYGDSFLQNISKWKNKARANFESGITHTSFGNPPIEHYGLIYRPVDKRENYIKRCVGLPGDFLELKNSVLYVNGKKAQVPAESNLRYAVIAGMFSKDTDSRMEEKYGLLPTNYEFANRDEYGRPTGPLIAIHADKTSFKKLKKNYGDLIADTVTRDAVAETDPKQYNANTIIENMLHFPNDPNINNTKTDFVRFQVPKKGMTVKITPENIAYYRRIISVYEDHKLQEKSDGSIWIDGKKATSYTFEMNYYWMMGDNRFRSADSRIWGFVPEDHIVGKASMVWFSSGPSGVRWDRLFMGIE